MVSVMCRIQFKNKKRVNGLIIGLNKTIDQLATNCLCWYTHVMKGGWSSFERGISFRFKANGRTKRTCKKQDEEGSITIGLSRKMHFTNQNEMLARLPLA